MQEYFTLMKTWYIISSQIINFTLIEKLWTATVESDTECGI